MPWDIRIPHSVRLSGRGAIPLLLLHWYENRFLAGRDGAAAPSGTKDPFGTDTVIPPAR